MKTLEEAKVLAKAMVNIGKGAGRRIMALLTEMDRPLGYNIGNALEVVEAVDVLKGGGPSDLKEVCNELASNMLMLGGKGSLDECRELAQKAVTSGAAYKKFLEMVKKQGGDPGVIENTSKLPSAAIKVEWRAEKSGYISKMQAEKLGMASLLLGAGRKTKTDVIDPAAGIVFYKKTGDRVEKGEPVAILHTSKEYCVCEVTKVLNDSIYIEDNPPEKRPVILGRVD